AGLRAGAARALRAPATLLRDPATNSVRRLTADPGVFGLVIAGFTRLVLLAIGPTRGRVGGRGPPGGKSRHEAQPGFSIRARACAMAARAGYGPVRRHAGHARFAGNGPGAGIAVRCCAAGAAGAVPATAHLSRRDPEARPGAAGSRQE